MSYGINSEGSYNFAWLHWHAWVNNIILCGKVSHFQLNWSLLVHSIHHSNHWVLFRKDIRIYPNYKIRSDFFPSIWWNWHWYQHLFFTPFLPVSICFHVPFILPFKLIFLPHSLPLAAVSHRQKAICSYWTATIWNKWHLIEDNRNKWFSITITGRNRLYTRFYLFWT